MILHPPQRTTKNIECGIFEGLFSSLLFTVYPIKAVSRCRYHEDPPLLGSRYKERSLGGPSPSSSSVLDRKITETVS